jgi:hypothetical protein
VSGILAAVDVQDLSSYKAIGFEEHHCLDDVPDLTQAADREKLRERLARLRRIASAS